MIYRKLVSVLLISFYCTSVLCFGSKNLRLPQPDNGLAKAIESASTMMRKDISEDLFAMRFMPKTAPHIDAEYLNFDDTFFEYGNSEIILSNIRFQEPPQANISKAEPNIMYNYLDVATEWTNVFIEASYQIYQNRNLREFNLFEGNLRFGWKKIKANGRVGFNELDSNRFESTNYGLTYTKDGFAFDLLDQNIARQNNEILDAARKHFETFMENDVTRKLRSILRADVDNLLQDKSVEKLFGGNHKVVQKYRSFVVQTRDVGNTIVDDLLELIRAALLQSGYNVIPLNDIYKDFRRKFGFITFSGYLSMSDGSARDLASIRRMSDFSFYVNGENIELSGSLGFGEVSAKYEHYEAKIWNIGPSGEVKASVDDNELYIKLVVVQDDESSYGFSLIDYDVKAYLGKIKVNATGLTFLLNWLLNIITTSVANTYRSDITEAIERYLSNVLGNIASRY